MDHSDDKADPHPVDARDWSLGEAAEDEDAKDQADRRMAAEDKPGEDHSGEHEAAAAGEAKSPTSASTHATGSNLKPLDSGISDLAPFFPRPEASGAAGSTRRFASHIDFASNAALVICVLGFAFAAGTYFFSGAAGGGSKMAVATQADAEQVEMLRTTQKMVADMSALKANVEALRVSLAQGQAAAGSQRGFEKSLDTLKTKLDSAKTETAGQLAELSAKVDRLQRDPALQQVAERLDRIEKQTASTPATGSVAPLVRAATQDRDQKSPPATEAPKRPTLITSWVVRDVYNGVALVENARGSIEVALGDTIPGAGTVKAIERRGGGWIVITSRGLVDYDHTIMIP